MKLNVNIIAMLHEVEARHGFVFLKASTRITHEELTRAMLGLEVRSETCKRLTAWTSDRIEMVERKPQSGVYFKGDCLP